MPTYTFEKVTRPVSKRLPCPTCGKKIRRSTTLYQTLNPFNKNEDGTVKTFKQILAELEEQAKEWQAKPVKCTPCSDE